MTCAHFDVETRSRIDLRKCGQYRYFGDYSSQFILGAWSIDDDYPQVWNMLRDPMPKRFREAALEPSVTFKAHNVSYERVGIAIMGARTGVIPADVRKALKPLTRWSCTAARSAAIGLPRSLDSVAKALKLPVQKDEEGRRLMLKMCRPRALDAAGRPLWHEHPQQIDRLGEYCVVDVLTEQAVDKAVPELTEFERRVWMLTESMNDRGVMVDDAFVVAAILAIDEAESDLNKRIGEISNGAVTKITQVAKLKSGWKNKGWKLPTKTALASTPSKAG